MAGEWLGVRKIVPMHYGTFPELTGTPAQLREFCRHRGIDVVELRPGDTDRYETRSPDLRGLRSSSNRPSWFPLCVFVYCFAPARFAQQLAPIRYTLSFPAAHTHYVDVEASIPTDGQRQVDLMMPVWTPGSYLVREYSRNVESLTARDAGGGSLPLEKTRKNRWRVAATGGSITLRYRVYAHEMSVRANWVDDEFALLNGAATYITRLDGRDRPYEIDVRLPAAWSRSVSGMTSPSPNTYRSPDYDTLVDSPIVAGNPAMYPFTVAGKPHYLVDVAERGVWDGAKAVKDLEKSSGRPASSGARFRTIAFTSSTSSARRPTAWSTRIR